MRHLFASSLILSILSKATLAQEPPCDDLAILGTPNLDRYDGSIDLEVDDDCRFTWSVTFKHDDTLPIPDDPATQCDPSVVPPVLAPDGLPYYAFRWSYMEGSDYFKAVTNVDHVSVDFNPCGHPPADVFTTAHYDIHTYAVTPELRTCMTCIPIPGTPLCDPGVEQPSPYAQAFFAPLDGNFPPGYVPSIDNVLWMGGHTWIPEEEPTAADWFEPFMIMGSYNGTNIFYEPMFPVEFVTGDTSNFWEQDITYVDQTIMTLADYMSVEYDAESGYTVATFTGMSAVCDESSSRSRRRRRRRRRRSRKRRSGSMSRSGSSSDLRGRN